MDSGGLGLCFGRWYCLQAEFYSSNGISFMKFVVLRSGTLLQEDAVGKTHPTPSEGHADDRGTMVKLVFPTWNSYRGV